MKGSRLVGAGLTALLVLTAAACGSDDDESSTADTTTTTAAAVDDGAPAMTAEEAIADAVAAVQDDPLSGTAGSGLARGVTASSITFGCVYEAANYAGMTEAIEARFAAINDDGGIHGRTLELKGGCQDDGSGANTLQVVQRLVERDEVFGIYTSTQGMSPAVATYLNREEVPYLGWGYIDAFCGKRWGFGFDGCLNGQASSRRTVPHPFYNAYLVQPMVEHVGGDPGDIRAAVIAVDSQAGEAAVQNYSAQFEHLGAAVVYAEPVVPLPGPTTDYTPFVQAALAEDPNVILLATQFSDIGGITAAIKAAGFEGDIMNVVAYVPGLLSAAKQLADALDGTYVVSSFVPQEQGGAYIEQFAQGLEDSGGEPFITLGGALGYFEADVVTSMLEAVGEDLDTATFDETVNGGSFTYTSSAEDGPCSVPWPAGHFFAASGAALLRISGTTYEVDAPFVCFGPFPATS